MSRANRINPEHKATFPGMPKDSYALRLTNASGRDTPLWRNRRREGRGSRDFNLDSHQGRQQENTPDRNMDIPMHLLWCEYQSLEAHCRATLPFREFCELRAWVGPYIQPKKSNQKFYEFDGEVGRPSDLKASDCSLPLPCVNSGPHLESNSIKHTISRFFVGMKEDIMSSKVVDSKKDDPKGVSCDGQSALTMGTMAIDPIGVNYDSPCVLIVGTMAIDTRVYDPRILIVGTMPIDTDVVDSNILGELSSMKIPRSQALDNYLCLGDVIHELLLQALNAYRNPIEKGQKIKVELTRLEFWDQKGFSWRINDQGRLTFGRLLKIIDCYGLRGSIFVSWNTQLLLEEQFHFLVRELKVISGIPEQFQAGFMLEDVVVGIIDNRGNIDAYINEHNNNDEFRVKEVQYTHAEAHPNEQIIDEMWISICPLEDGIVKYTKELKGLGIKVK
eukprot:Gb_32224 [translate_table: standard]